MNERTYSWSIPSAVYQMKNGAQGPTTENACHWLEDKIENGSATEVNEIAVLLFNTVAELTRKETSGTDAR